MASHDLSLECRGVSHWFGAKKVLADINLTLRRGQFLSLVGGSGCGKSTLLRAIVGTHLPLQGKILLFPREASEEGVAVYGPGRDRGIVYQHYSLFPFLTAQENVAIGLALDETSIPYRFFCWPKWRRLRREHMTKAADMLAKVRLADAMRLYPQEMSGGMRQRVALAQAMIMRPEIILLDEPFGALDEATREGLQHMLLGLYRENEDARRRNLTPPYTLIIVTHELNEALYVGDRVVGLSAKWNWQAQGHTDFPGATVVYDKSAPVFETKTANDYQQFARQKEEIRRVVFEAPEPVDRTAHVTYWQEAAAPTQ